MPAPPVQADTPTAFVTASLLNVRATPDLDGEVIGMVAASEAWPIIGRDAAEPAWWQIQYGSRRAGSLPSSSRRPGHWTRWPSAARRQTPRARPPHRLQRSP
ncbi:MAG: SH3 domain-containing protein [Caldilineaceae bacterium]